MDLNKGFKLNKEIRTLDRLIKYKIALAESITSSANEVKGSGHSDKIARAITDKVILEQRQEQLKDELEQWKKDLKQKIDKINCNCVNGYIYKALLEERYINFKSWLDISLMFNVSHDNARGYLKNKAIDALKKEGD